MPRGRKILVGAVLTVFAAVAAVALATQMGDRRPGQSLTGNAQEVSADDRLAAARRDVEDRPNDSQTHLAYAHALVGSKDFAAALKEYDTAFRLDPKNAEARAYGGWLLYLVSDEVGGDSIAKAMKLLDEAIAADPQFPDSHFFRGMVLLRGLGQPAAAATEFETYLAASPNGPYAEQVRALLEQARGGGTTTTSR
jgi:cytochrome c-type biogenesis protein CcmH/NrfG